MTDEADRLIAAALQDHARIAAPKHLRRRLERMYLGRRSWWLAPLVSGLAGALLATAILLVVVRPQYHTMDPAVEAVGDHLRLLGARGLGVEASDMHQVKPWFAGKLDFVPPITFLGDDEFPLTGGDVAIFMGRKAAAFVYRHRLHIISLFVFETSGNDHSERTIHGFHILTWSRDGFGFSLVGDVNWDRLRTLHSRLQ